jgi:hypothetical protein
LNHLIEDRFYNSNEDSKALKLVFDIKYDERENSIMLYSFEKIVENHFKDY